MAAGNSRRDGNSSANTEKPTNKNSAVHRKIDFTVVVEKNNYFYGIVDAFTLSVKAIIYLTCITALYLRLFVTVAFYRGINAFRSLRIH